MAALRVLAIGSACAVVWAAAAGRAADTSRLPLLSIVPGAVVAQAFGCTTLQVEPSAPRCPTKHFHSGVDLAAHAGASVHAATSGVARVAYDPSGAGLFVTVAFSPHVRVLYCHLLRALVSTGTDVSPGDLVGLVGTTGLTTGPHLHFEIQVDGRPVDPGPWLALAP